MANKRSIVLKGTPVVSEEGVAQETIKPGYLVKGVTSVSKQTATNTSMPKALALSRSELGTGIDNARQGSGTISAFYASGDRIKVGVFAGGMEAVGFVASGQNISEDTLLECNGSGLFASGTTKPIARAMETLGTVTVETALRVQFL